MIKFSSHNIVSRVDSYSGGISVTDYQEKERKAREKERGMCVL